MYSKDIKLLCQIAVTFSKYLLLISYLSHCQPVAVLEQATVQENILSVSTEQIVRALPRSPQVLFPISVCFSSNLDVEVHSVTSEADSPQITGAQLSCIIQNFPVGLN